MAGDILSIGVSGLLAYQQALSTVSNNVSNANTEGYSRQVTVLATQTPQQFGTTFVGTGVKVSSIERQFDAFLTNQVQGFNSSFNEAEALATYATIVDNMLADPQVGLMPTVENFFAAMQDLANDPSSTVTRQAVLSEAEALVDRFGYLNQRFEDLRNQVDRQMEGLVGEINTMTSAIAELNQQIVSVGGSAPPNDLLDDRDRLLSQLSEKVAVTSFEQGDGAINVFIGTGQAVVTGASVQLFQVMNNTFDISQNEIGITTVGGGVVEVTNMLNGGTLGGLLDFREQVLDPAQNDLGRLAIGMGSAINAQHNLGMNLNDTLGGDFFNIGSLQTQLLPATGVTPTVNISLSDAAQLRGDEYILRYEGGTNYTLRRESDGQAFALDSAVPSTLTVDGFTLSMAGGATVGDAYLIRPTRGSAADISVQVSDVNAIAAAAPIRTAANLGNSGGAAISAGVVTDAANLPLPADVTLAYNLATNNFSVIGAVPPVAPIPFVSGTVMAFNGLELVVTGTPADTDRFTLSANTGGSGDNRNALLLGGLQSQSLLGDTGSGATETFQESYGQLVASVGISTRQAQLAEVSQGNLLQQARNEQLAVSGVNLDEEAANLMRFQQAYQAAAQVIGVADTIFQSLLAAVRR